MRGTNSRTKGGKSPVYRAGLHDNPQYIKSGDVPGTSRRGISRGEHSWAFVAVLYFSCKDSPQPNLYWYKRPRQSDTKFHKDPLVNMPAAMKAITVSGMPKANDPAGAVTMKGPGTKPDGDTLKNLRIGDGCFIAVADTPTGEHVGGGEMAGSKGTEWFIHGEVEWTDSNGKKDFCNVGAVVSFPSTQGTGQNAGKEFFKAKVDYKSGPEVKNILENKVNDPLPFNG